MEKFWPEDYNPEAQYPEQYWPEAAAGLSAASYWPQGYNPARAWPDWYWPVAGTTPGPEPVAGAGYRWTALERELERRRREDDEVLALFVAARSRRG